MLEIPRFVGTNTNFTYVFCNIKGERWDGIYTPYLRLRRVDLSNALHTGIKEDSGRSGDLS